MNARGLDIGHKTALVRQFLQDAGGAAVRLKSIEWFGWITAGGSSAVLQTVEGGVAEVLITKTDFIVLTDAIEAPRIRDEELLPETWIHTVPWAQSHQQQAFVDSHAKGGVVFSDRPSGSEQPFPEHFWLLRHSLTPYDIERYRALGKSSAEAMTEALKQAHPDQTENELAGVGASALRSRGLDVGLVQVAGKRRLNLYRHVPPQNDPLGPWAMMSFCARQGGLWVSLTRFVAFEPLPAELQEKHHKLKEIESAVLQATCAGNTLGQMYHILKAAYASRGEANAILEHHQGGPTGYGCRERIALPSDPYVLQALQAFAWNPSLRGAKIEDTVLLHEDGSLEVLTLDPSWPASLEQGLLRPDVLHLP